MIISWVHGGCRTPCWNAVSRESPSRPRPHPDRVGSSSGACSRGGARASGKRGKPPNVSEGHNWIWKPTHAHKKNKKTNKIYFGVSLSRLQARHRAQLLDSTNVFYFWKLLCGGQIDSEGSAVFFLFYLHAFFFYYYCLSRLQSCSSASTVWCLCCLCCCKCKFHTTVKHNSICGKRD